MSPTQRTRGAARTRIAYRPAEPTVPVMNRTNRHRSDTMYLMNEALARARCAEQPKRASRPAREVAMEAAKRRRDGQAR